MTENNEPTLHEPLTGYQHDLLVSAGMALVLWSRVETATLISVSALRRTEVACRVPGTHHLSLDDGNALKPVSSMGMAERLRKGQAAALGSRNSDYQESAAQWLAGVESLRLQRNALFHGGLMVGLTGEPMVMEIGAPEGQPWRDRQHPLTAGEIDAFASACRGVLDAFGHLPERLRQIVRPVPIESEEGEWVGVAKAEHTFHGV